MVMTNFKGTKGKWVFDKTPEKYELKHIVFDDNQFAVVQGKDREANALLISKAPEMLEMLEEVKSYLSYNLRSKVDQLIKEATEL